MIKHDDKQYLMKRRRYGWGWIPVTWQAILLIAMQIAIIFTAVTFLPAKPVQPSIGELTAFFAITALSIGTIVLFGMVNAPKPRWRWGEKPSDNPDQDF